MIDPTYVIYHKSCADGFGAAWAIHQYFDQIKKPKPYFLAWQHGDGLDFPEKVDGHDLLIVDFSFPRESLLELQAKTKSIRVIDHHKTAQAALEGLDFCEFDMTQSGAMLAWKAFHPNTDPPELIRYVQDRDLWQWKLPDSKEYSACLASHPFDVDVWTMLAQQPAYMMALEGSAILRYQGKLVQSTVENAEPWHMAGRHVMMAKCPFLQSEIGHALLKDQPFGATLFEVEDDTVFSLRSDDDHVDVSVIAKKFGGGGHRNAAGFKSAARESPDFHPTRRCEAWGCR